MATSTGGGKKNTLPRLPSKSLGLALAQRGGTPSFLGTVDPASSGFPGLYGRTGIPLQPDYTFVTEACACKLAYQAKSGLLACCIWPV